MLQNSKFKNSKILQYFEIGLKVLKILRLELCCDVARTFRLVTLNSVLNQPLLHYKQCISFLSLKGKAEKRPKNFSFASDAIVTPDVFCEVKMHQIYL